MVKGWGYGRGMVGKILGLGLGLVEGLGKKEGWVGIQRRGSWWVEYKGYMSRAHGGEPLWCS